ncbi:MAG: DUF935 family protein [Kiritimatiellae bacterium]|nr:DUF935 family protein [Kiritimatiellia bacterium]
MPRAKPKTESAITAERVKQKIASRFNPIRGLTPSKLSSYLDRFDTGYVADAAYTWQQMEERDDVLLSVCPKRKKAVARHGWNIVQMDDSPESQRHKEALEYFYNHLRATSAVDLNVKGSVKLLVRQMMDAEAKQYAVHEIVWRPSPAGLSALFKFVPLWFFENTTGALRFIAQDGSVAGADLLPGEWMVTTGSGLMKACSICYVFKHMPLKDWVIFSEKFGMPGLHGKTDAAKGSDEWNDLVDSLANFGIDWAAVTNRACDIDAIEVHTAGDLPFPPLVERMDRAIAALWRGADLSTISSTAGEGTGASLQGEEADILEDDDAEMISEMLQEQVDRFVIQYTFGRGVEPLAYFQLATGTKQDVERDLKIDEAFAKHGIPQSRKDWRERYGRQEPDPADELVTAPAAPASPMSSSNQQPGLSHPGPGSSQGAGALKHSFHPAPISNQDQNAAGPAPDLPAPPPTEAEQADRAAMATLLQTARSLHAQAEAEDLEPVANRLVAILRYEGWDAFSRELVALKNDLPSLLIAMNRQPASARIFEHTLAAAIANGWAVAATRRDVA